MQRLLLTTPFCALLACATAPSRSPYEATVLAAVKDYATTYDIMMLAPDRSPVDCLAPSFPIGPTRSEAKTNDGGHGHKLYYLYARDAHAYRAQTGLFVDYGRFTHDPTDSPYVPAPPVTHQEVGQVIIKESWTDVPLADPASRPVPRPNVDRKHTTVEAYTSIGDQLHQLGQRSALFVMMKVAPESDPRDSDAGWIYATLTPDAQTITSIGQLPTCMSCHTQAPRDRLFGPKR